MTDLEALAREAFHALEESGLDEDSGPSHLGAEWRIHLRKACWFLVAARSLVAQEGPGPRTAAAEPSFSAIERTHQAALIRPERFEPEDFRSHVKTFERAGERVSLQEPRGGGDRPVDGIPQRAVLPCWRA